MYRKCMLVLLCLGLSSVSLAQNFYDTYYMAGPVIKLVQSKFNFDSDLVNVPESEPEVGYQLGGFFRTRINDLYVQPELLISRTKNQLIFPNHDGINGFNPRAEFEYTSIEMPLSIGYYFGNVRLDTGPTVSILTKANQFFLNEKTDITDQFNKVSLQYRVGVGLDINNVLVNLNYEFGLSKTGENLRRLVGTSFEPKRSQIALSVGLILHRQRKRQ